MKINIKKIFGFFCIVIAIVFTVWQTKMFGGNLVADSASELLFGITGLFLFFAGLLLLKNKH